MNILFWNLNKKDLGNELSELVNSKNIDILAVCEYNIHDSDLLKKLNKHGNTFKVSNNFACEKVKIFTKISLSHFSIVLEDIRWTIRKINHPSYSPFLMIITHLPSKYNLDDDSLFIESMRFKDSINKAKSETNIDRVLILGDLNMNPFDKGVIGATGLNAVPDKRIALKEKRSVQGKQYDYFYNPMWNFFGDENQNNVSGTYFYRNSGHFSFDWNIFDQVLLSPSMIEYIPFDKIKIVTQTKKSSFLSKNGRIDSNKYSDHLPIEFQILPDKLT